MIKFDLQARAGLSNASAYAIDVCRSLADTLFPLEFQMICKSAKNNYQLSFLFDNTLMAKAMSLERLRDPSHTRCLTIAELRMALQDADLTKVEMASRNIEVNLNSWMDLTGADPEVRRIIQKELTGELDGKQITGMRPFLRDGQLMFTQTWTTAVGVK